VKLKYSLLITLSFFLNDVCLHAQSTDQIDSLKQIINTSENDTTIVKAYIEWDNLIYANNPSLDLELNGKIEEICTQKLLGDISEKEQKLYLRYLANSLSNIGLIYQNEGKDSIAVVYHLESAEIDQQIDKKDGVITSLNNIAIIYQNQGDFANALDYFSRSLKISESIDDKGGVANSLNNIGIIYDNLGDYPKAITHLSRSLEIREEIGEDRDIIANSLNNIGLIYKNQGAYAKAIEYLSRSLLIRELIGNKEGIGTSLNNIGLIYHEQEDYENAIDYYTRCLKINEEIGDKKGVATSLNNIGLVYHDQDKYDQAIDYYDRCLRIKEEIGDKKSIATSLNNLGSYYNDQGNYEQSLSLLLRSLKIREEIEDKKGIATSLNDLGLLYKNQGDYAQAIHYSSRSLKLAEEMGTAMEITHAANALFEAYKENNESAKALEMHVLYIEMRDSINSEANRKEIIRQEYKYQYEKQAVADSIKNQELQKVKDAQLALQKAENKQQRLKAYFLYIGLFITLLFGGFIFNRFRITRKQKEIIENQKDQVDLAFGELAEKNKEILDSINYAKRIQSAILPPDKLIKDHLHESFVLYKPKDIVAGDFYWLEQKQNHILFAAADCTGHGVPGAMVSVVCNNGLNRSVREYDLDDPGQILDKTRELVIQEFEKSEGEVKDGMDIALCSLDNNNLKYAGAYNPLWIIRDNKVLVTKADKQPIGKYEPILPFTTHSIELEKGDTIYIFSDGYADQFGGPKGKKLKAKAFQALLLSIQNETMEMQHQLIDDAFEEWRGNEEQIDDVVVMGIRV
jgi:tetratricopeptide (TPR) repeat protein